MEFDLKFPMFMLKFEKPVEYMYRFGKKYSKPLKVLGNISVLVGIFGMLIAGALLAKGSIDIINGGPASVGLVIPGVRIPGSPVYIPLVEGLIAILLLAVFHEGMHGIMAAAHGIKSKYTALILFLFIPAAGVEIDEEKLAKTSKLAKLRIFAAGSMGNFILAILVLGLLFPTGYVVQQNSEDLGLKVLNSTNMPFEVDEVILSINNQETRSIIQLREVLGGLEPGSEVVVKTDRRELSGNLEDDGKLGIYLEPLFEFTSIWGKIFAFIGKVLAISFSLNIGVGLMNLLPLGILDGGRMFSEMSKKLYPTASTVALFLLLMNLFGSYVF
ncbi:MAG: hypothetical protein GOU98_01005 [Candidatus Altiarchaeota archaeon]|nr:hypothetical protein [Candidatus Altiarchaeota archaeon]